MAVGNPTEGRSRTPHFPTAEKLGISPEDAKRIAGLGIAVFASLVGMGLIIFDFQNRQQQIPPVPTQTPLPNTYDPRGQF